MVGCTSTSHPLRASFKETFVTTSANVVEAQRLIHQAVAEAINPDERLNLKELQAELADGLLPLFEKVHQSSDPRSAGAIGLRRYAIRDRDLNLIDTLLKIFGTGAGVGFLLTDLGGEHTPANITKLVAGTVVAIFSILYNLRLAVKLEDLQYAILLQLYRAKPNGLTNDELLEGLRDKFSGISVEMIDEKLENMREIPTLMGSPVALVWKKDQVWRSNDI